VSGLLPGKEYFYQTYAVQILQFHPYYIYYGDTITSKPYSFKTLDAKKDEIAFTVLADIHANNEKLNSHLKQEMPNNEFYFFNGDMVSYIENEDALFKGFINTSVDFFAKQKPFFYVRGNHETRGVFARQFTKYFSSNNQRNYYSFTQGPVHFIVLDGGEDKADNNRYYYSLADFENYRLEQAIWLKEQVKSPDFLNSKFRIVLVHMPVMKYDDAWPGTQSNYNHWGEILNNAGIDLMVSGHEHKFSWYDKKNSSMKYPILISDNNQRIEFRVNPKQMQIEVKELDGSITKTLSINKN
jgi:predicted phosphodiesterase